MWERVYEPGKPNPEDGIVAVGMVGACSSPSMAVDTNKRPEVRTRGDPSQGPTPINGEDMTKEEIPVVIYITGVKIQQILRIKNNVG